ncbi:DUF2269 family protein [Nakamurella sp. YIM 132087]|uniref:DUF2269 family protein n=1 Tax=Nakamurella alba TaxID=2665158 RepID=A0A7K1FQL9_9ACTN|nr:DUF2269 family protein [Nakamurella alba]MTD16370.1 DUF2269 family protein [Nakamurella alba]
MLTFLTVLHVVAAVFVIGPMAILPMTAMRAIRAEQGGQVAVLARSTFVFTAASLVVALLGFAVVPFVPEQYGTTLTTPWVLISIILYVVALALNLLAVVPALRSAAEHLQSAATGGQQNLTDNDYKRIAMTSGIVSLLLVAITVLMVWKP